MPTAQPKPPTMNVHLQAEQRVSLASTRRRSLSVGLSRRSRGTTAYHVPLSMTVVPTYMKNSARPTQCPRKPKNLMQRFSAPICVG